MSFMYLNKYYYYYYYYVYYAKHRVYVIMTNLTTLAPFNS